MTGFRNMLQGAAGAAGGGYSVDNSIVLDDGSSQYLTRTPSAAGNLKTFTVSFWFKRGNLGILTYLLKRRTAGFGFIRINADDTLTYYNEAGGVAIQLITTQVFRDPHSWYHLVVVQDTTQATASDRAKMYLNGSEITAFNTAQYNIAQNGNGTLFDADTLDIGQSSTQFWDGYLSEYCYIDGAALTETSFGEYDTNGVWRPVDVSGLTFGTNGFYLPFSTGSGANLGANSVSASTFTPAAANYTYNATYLTIGSGTINNNGSPGVSGRLNNPFNGDFTFSFTATAIAGSIFGVFDATELSTFSTGTDDGGLDSMTNSWWYDDGGNGTGGGGTVGNGYFMYGNSSQGTGPIAAGSVVTIERTGSTIKITDDSSDAHSFSQTFSGPVYIMVGHRNITSKSMDYDSVSMNGIEAFAVTGSPTQSSDTPTVNAATFSPLSTRLQTSFTPVTSDWTFTNGNRTITHTSGASGDIMAAASQLLQPGQKYHFEVITESMHSSIYARFALALVPKSMYEADSSPLTGTNDQFEISLIKSGGSGSNTAAFDDSALTAPTNKPTTNSRLTFEVDMSTIGSTTVRYYFDGSLDTTYSSLGFADEPYYIVSFTGVETDRNGVFNFNFGSSDFTDTPTTGHIGLTAKAAYQASAPAIEDGTAYFQATLYTGDGADGNEVNQSGNSTFQPDLLWVKSRSSGSSHCLFDAVRGASERLFPNLTNAEVTSTEYLASFDADGFTMNDNSPIGVGDTNVNTTTYVGWQWKGGGEPTTDNVAGAGATPTAGSVKIDGSNLGSSLGGTIPVTRLSANRTSGFSIGTYTGSGSNGTIATGLTTKPDMLIIKKRGDDGGNNWVTYHSGLANQGTGYVDLGTTALEGTLANMFNSVAPGASDATLFNVGTNTSTNDTGGTDTYVFYAFHSVAGYSAFGSYVGNNSTDGPLILLDFKPALILIKKITISNIDWFIWDNQRSQNNDGSTEYLSPSNVNSESVFSDGMDVGANFFKLRTAEHMINGVSNPTYIYAAFAENPFAGSTPATAR